MKHGLQGTTVYHHGLVNYKRCTRLMQNVDDQATTYGADGNSALHKSSTDPILGLK